MPKKFLTTVFISLLSVLLAACSAAPEPRINLEPGSLRFSGERAFQIEEEFVTKFPHRHSGQPNNKLAAEWISGQLTELGWDCHLDKWEIFNYSRTVPLNNVVCVLPGESDREILVVAHHDQASTTIQGADNDGSGVSILLQLAEIFAADAPHRYTLAFVFTDAEEYGMIGSKRYVQTHPNPESIIAGISLDNLGRYYYDGMSMELVGQYRHFGPIWLALLARESARAADIAWEVYLPSTIDQVTGQAAPISFMDQGPIVAAGIPALGFTGHVPPQFSDEHYGLWHDPDDTLEKQSAEALGQSGLIVEALIRQLQSMESFPQASGPYLYFDADKQILSGLPLWLVFIAFTGLFFLGSFSIGRHVPAVNFWKEALPHFLELWLPLLASILLLYLFVVVGLMDAFASYPATTKDPYLLNPRWPAIILFLVGLSIFMLLGRRASRRYIGYSLSTDFNALKSFALLIVGIGTLYVLIINPFSLLFFVPLVFWFFIKGRSGVGKLLDVLFFLLGGLVVYALFYFFGFLTLRYDFAFFWYLLNMFSVGMISFPTAAIITAILAAGLMLVVKPPQRVK